LKLAIIGSKGVGKDYLALKTGYTKFSFADVIKRHAEETVPEIKGTDTHELKDVNIPGIGIPREIWYKEAQIKRDKTKWWYFYELSIIKLKKLITKTENIVITDIRNWKEFYGVKDLGFTCIYLTRPQVENFTGVDYFIGEFVDDIDIHFYNDNSIDFLEFLENIKSKNI